MNRAALLSLIAALIATGLIAGLYYAFTCAVMPGLARTDDRAFVLVMQRINVFILNPAFFFSFAGALVFSIIAALLQWRLEHREAALWIAAASVLYGVTIIVTMAVNVPLNDALAHSGDPNRLSVADLGAVRQAFERPWVAANIVRAMLSAAALACLGWALMLQGRGDALRL